MRKLFQESRGTILGIRMMQFDIVILMLGSNDFTDFLTYRVKKSGTNIKYTRD